MHDGAGLRATRRRERPVAPSSLLHLPKTYRLGTGVVATKAMLPCLPLVPFAAQALLPR